MLRFWGGGADKNRFHTRNCSFPSPALLLQRSREGIDNMSALDAASVLHCTPPSRLYGIHAQYGAQPRLLSAL